MTFATYRLPCLCDLCDLLEVRASVEEVQRIRVEDCENGVFFDGDLHIYTVGPILQSSAAGKDCE